MVEPRDDVRDESGEGYEPPCITETAEFETLAMACGKIDPDVNPECFGNESTS